MKVSLIFSLTVHATLPLMQKLFFDSVYLIVHMCDTQKKHISHCLLLKETVKFHELSASFQVNFEFCLNKFQN